MGHPVVGACNQEAGEGPSRGLLRSNLREPSFKALDLQQHVAPLVPAKVELALLLLDSG